jgi:hypothetical protein
LPGFRSDFQHAVTMTLFLENLARLLLQEGFGVSRVGVFYFA